MDVTGHGIAAALTVNRLYGEVERLFAEDPHAGPGDVLVALNRYVHLTLATHSIYVTALCLRVDQEAERLEYASGGHPPAFLCYADGRIDQLDSTSFVLGACAGADFQPSVQTRSFRPGDTLVAYTDGALECRNQSGRMLGVKGLAAMVDSAFKANGGSRHAMAAAVLAAVDSYRYGPPEDDTLIVEIACASSVREPTVHVDGVRQRTTMPV
jgi:sigma-B regulation protein RsbU (phosphoserine phosphatase)